MGSNFNHNEVMDDEWKRELGVYLLHRRTVNLITECWHWTERLNENGYGVFYFYKKAFLAHRASAIAFMNFVPKKRAQVLHKCDNPKCFNPEHLFIGTQRDNVLDMDKKGRRGTPFGELAGSCKLTTADVLEIRKHTKYFHGLYTRLSEKYGVTKVQIRNILKRRKWKHV